MAGPIRFVVDSTADLDPAYQTAHNITVVPLRVIFGDEELRDFFDISPAELYQRMESSKVAPRTSQPTPMEFEETFRAASAEGQTIICTTISAEISGTWNSAQTARATLADRDIRIIDTRSASVGHNLLVRAAVELAEAGADADTICTSLEWIKRNQRLVFTVETLEHLRRGGRIGGARALVGSVLSIKPVLEFREGQVDTLDKVRTYQRAIDRLVEEVRLSSETWKSPVVAVVCHAARRETAERLAEQITSLCMRPPQIMETGPVIGCHGGPGAIGIGYHKPLPAVASA